ncbi:MAG TPA: transposase, partial [Kineosporiaceae bacterium]
DDVAYWLAMHTPAWRDRIRYVAIDMCTVFVSAIRRYLPKATIVVDHFYVDLRVMPMSRSSVLVRSVPAARRSA